MTFSRLTLGEPRLKSKLRGGEVSTEPPCEEPRLTGEIIEDQSVENQTTGGPSGVELPSIEDAFSGGDEPYIYSDGSAADPTEFIHTEGVGGDFPFISTANPRSGTDHIRAPNSFNEKLFKGAQQTCDATGFHDLQSLWGYFYTAVVMTGDVIDASCYFAPSLSSSQTKIFVGMDFFNASYARIAAVGTETFVPNTPYTQVSHSHVAPSGSSYVICHFQPTVPGFGTHADFDDFSVTIS